MARGFFEAVKRCERFMIGENFECININTWGSIVTKQLRLRNVYLNSTQTS